MGYCAHPYSIGEEEAITKERKPSLRKGKCFLPTRKGRRCACVFGCNTPPETSFPFFVLSKTIDIRTAANFTREFSGQIAAHQPEESGYLGKVPSRLHRERFFPSSVSCSACSSRAIIGRTHTSFREWRDIQIVRE